MHGWLVIDKPVGIGSTQVVSAVKRALREGGYPKVRVGHGGTLDPLASGVLPVAIGEATKLAGRMLDSDKIYEFTIRFGEETATLDAEGAVVHDGGHRADEDESASGRRIRRPRHERRERDVGRVRDVRRHESSRQPRKLDRVALARYRPSLAGRRCGSNQRCDAVRLCDRRRERGRSAARHDRGWSARSLRPRTAWPISAKGSPQCTVSSALSTDR